MAYKYDRFGDIESETETGTVPTDEKGRVDPAYLTEREMLIEITTHSRRVTDLVNSFFGDLKSGKINPMQMMMGVFGKK